MDRLAGGVRYDEAAARQSVRRGRELRKSGIDPHGPAPKYRVWGRRSGSVMARLYRD